jgi:hypothetical protein
MPPPSGHGSCRRSALLALLSGVLAGGLVTGAPVAVAQQSGTAVELVLAALPAVRETLPPGTAAVDPQLICTPRLIGWSCPAEVVASAEGLGMILHSRNFVRVCPGDQRSCRLVSARSLVHFTEPQVQGTSANLTMEVWWETDNNSRPLAHRRARLSFHREGAEWRLDRTEPLVATAQ